MAKTISGREEKMMHFQIETIPKYRVAYMRRVGPYGLDNTEVWENLKKWATEKNLLKSTTTLLAVQQDNPETTPPENCRFDACIVISEDYQVDESICENVLPGGKYMIYQVKHTKDAIQNAYPNIFSSIQKSDYIIDNRPVFERYIGDMNNNHYCEICVPVKLET